MSKMVAYDYSLVLAATAENTFTMPLSAAPGAASGQIDITPMRDPAFSNYAPDEMMVVLTADKACDADQILAVYGCSAKLGIATFLASLNNAAAIPIGGASCGFSWPIDGVGGFDSLAFGGLKANPLVTFSGGALVTIRVLPIRSKVRNS